MQTNEQLLSSIEHYLDEICYPEDPERLYAPISYALNMGGKRLRPMLLMLSCGIFTDHTDIAMPAAAAVEVFHNFTLLHDDIMDNAAMRRGNPSVYAKWGQNIAILSGDAMLISAYQQLARCRPTCCRVCSPASTRWHRGVRRTAVRHGLRDARTGDRRGVSAHDRAEDLGPADRFDRARCDHRRPPARRIPSCCTASPTSWDSPSSCRTTCWTATAMSGSEGDRRRYSGGEEDLPDGDCSRTGLRRGSQDTSRSLCRSADLRCREDRHRQGDLRPAGSQAAGRKSDQPPFRTGPLHARPTLIQSPDTQRLRDFASSLMGRKK